MSPPNEQAARVCPALEAAEEEANSTQILPEDDAERKLADLVARAAGRGFTLRQTNNGFVLKRGASSWHTSSLEVVAHVMTRGGVRQ